jgi:UDPglucose 6-dehydrogenase
MNLAVIGTGYVGLVTGTCFSEMGHDVTCVDIDEAKVAGLNKGVIPIYEPGLDEMVATNVEQGRLSFTTNMKEAIEEALFAFIAVGTPPLEDGTADLHYVLSVARSIGEHMNGYRIAVTKSTVPVGTAEIVRDAIQEALDERGVDHQFDVVSNPEFLREGSAIDDFMDPDRIVIGCEDPRTLALMTELYDSFAGDGHPIIAMSTTSSEMTKYAANSMLAAKISFMNEVSAICERVGADVEDVRLGIGADNRIGYQFINPGIGYGGSCFPKDVKALISTAKSAGHTPVLLEAIEAVNEYQKRTLFAKVSAYYDGDVTGKTFAIWGLSFKPETDDTREAPALVIIDALLNAGAKVQAYDPKGMEETKMHLGDREGLEYATSNYEALEGCDALLLVTEWSYFRNPDFQRMKTLLKEPVVFDGRNVYSPDSMKIFGFDYFAVGREPVLGYSGTE